jgi:hypothetical protein
MISKQSDPELKSPMSVLRGAPGLREMFRVVTAFGAALLAALLTVAGTYGDWQVVAPGIEYQEFTVSGPNNVYVARMQRTHADCAIDSMVAQGRLTGGTETVSSTASRHEDAIGYWGQTWGKRYDVIVAINGDFYSGGVPTGGQIASGWYAKRFTDFAGGSGFAWQLDRDAFIGECVRHVANKQKVACPATGQERSINGINRTRGTDELILYTHHYDLTTLTDNSGAEVLVRMTRPTLIIPPPNFAVGYVVQVRPNAGSTVIPFDHVVLSGSGSAMTWLLANVTVGAEVRISQEITHYLHDCSTPLAWDWTKTYASVGGSFHFLKNGEIQYSSDPGATTRHPRTAIALNGDYIFFIVVDGRSTQSVGMTMTELGTFCLSYLSATDGINQDGGGSSTMWVNGQVRNVPSDGTERAVANGVMMVNILPMEQSARFAAGVQVRTTGTVGLRVGPGTNYAVISTLSGGVVGTVISHALLGVRATGQYWWHCEFPAGTGWVPESALLEANCAGDYTGNGVIDAGDLSGLAFCMRGPAQTFAPGHFCLRGDSENDGDVDLADVSVMQTCVTGL